MKIKIAFIFLSILCAYNTNIIKNPPDNSTTQINTSTDLSPWHERHKDIILWKDAARDIYQIKVPQQDQRECSLHQTRNLLFLMSMLKGDDKNFLDEYKRMMDGKLLDEMASKSYCELMNGKYRQFPNVKRYLEENADFSKYLPSKSKEYLEDIIKLNFIDPTILNIQKALKLLPNIEGSSLSEEDVFSAAAVNIYNNKKLYEMIKNDNFLISIALGLNSLDALEHAAALLINKANNKLEFIFLDPLNWAINTEKNYQKIINHIYRLSTDINYFQQSFIRLLYVKLSNTNNIYFILNRENSNMPYEDLVKNKLFKVYKERFCSLITPINHEKFDTFSPDFKTRFESAEKYNEEIKKYRSIFGCDK